MSLSVQAAGQTDLGCVRKNNEDNFGYDTRLGLFVVCDGMGGAAAGEVASKLGVDTVLTYFREASRHHHYPVVGDTFEGVSVRANALASAIHLANQAIHETGTKSEGKRGMGSTIVAAMVQGNYLSIAHVGDSRIYLVRQGSIQQLTNDHSLVMEQVRRGLITREQAEKSEMQNIIIRALGSEDSVKPDVEDLVVLPGDVLLLCSDGLTKHVKDDWILGIILEAPDLEQACNDLIDAAKAHGGDDNITCVLVKTVQLPWYKKMFNIFGGNHRWQSST
ncbi:MAG: Stp1/IreP family PP2C-type Ser/Thr phosphatase [Acidobacteriales bacterium]|nr:Stp1/IreP family PP2C-type Ser/Thr phosphatase [Terriglobales bacterium]